MKLQPRPVVYEESIMSLVWNRRLSREIRELGYDIETGRLVVAFPDGVRKYYAPVSWENYTAIAHSSNPARLVRERIEGKVPRVTVAEYQ
jgi:hypothetical protein